MTEEQKLLATIEATWRHFYTTATFDRRFFKNTQMHCHIPQQYEMAVAQITTMVAGERIKEIKYPLDWWQAFKERWFPKFVLKRWPVQYHTWKIDFLYPDFDSRAGAHPEIAIYDSQRSSGYPYFEDTPQEYKDLEED